jgi:uncharacterized surface protein with fasciclin (FAS1) repeats
MFQPLTTTRLFTIIAAALGFGVFGAVPVAAGGTCGSTHAAKVAKTSSPDIVGVAKGAGKFNTLLAAAEAAGLVDALKADGPITVFAPTDDAFAKLPEGIVENLLKEENRARLAAILTYHVVPGKLSAEHVVKAGALDTLNGQRLEVAAHDDHVTIDGAHVLKADIPASNGVIHVIDAVMMPTSKDIVAIAAGNEQFTTLVAAVKAADLVEALQGDGPFTVFAPTDQAFAELPAGTVEALLKPENRDKLVSVLTYHVVPGRVFSDAAAQGATARTLQGSTLTTRAKDGQVYVNAAKVLAADIDSSNGVIHVIDRVILPPAAEQADAGN